MAQERKARTARPKARQVEFRKVPRRQGRQGQGALGQYGEAGELEARDREGD
jgi:hypothetical protein